MPQENIYFDEEEDEIVQHFAKLWNISKNDAVKKIVREFVGLDKLIIDGVL